MSHLIPEKRLDKNGVLTTKHVRASSAPAPARSLPAPGVTPTPKKSALKLTPRQKTPRTITFLLDYKESDAELTDRLAVEGYHYGKTVHVGYHFDASDAEFYDVHSTASLGNTAMLMKAAVRSKEDAQLVLRTFHLERLQEPYSAFSETMLRKRIPVEKYLAFHDLHAYSPEMEPQHYADAVEVFGVKAYLKTQTSEGRELFEEVLAGRFTAADLKKVGADKLSNTMEPDVLLNALAAIKDGTADYDADQLSAFLDKAGKEVNYSAALQLADKYGMGFIGGMVSVWKADVIARQIDNLPMEKQREILTYSNSIDSLMDPRDRSMSASEVIDLFHAGVEPGVAVEKWNGGAGVTVQQIIAINDGIAPSVSSGWL